MKGTDGGGQQTGVMPKEAPVAMIWDFSRAFHKVQRQAPHLREPPTRNDPSGLRPAKLQGNNGRVWGRWHE